VPVRVSGIDAQGNSFRHVVCTLDLSAKGVRISSLETLTARRGQELMLEHQKDRVRFEVVWIGEPGTSTVIPAVFNAVHAATGVRLRKMAIKPEMLKV